MRVHGLPRQHTPDEIANLERLRQFHAVRLNNVRQVNRFTPPVALPVVEGKDRRYFVTGIAGLLIGLLMSSEWGTPPDEASSKARERRRYLYIPAFLCADAVIQKMYPDREYGMKTIGSWSIGLLLGLLLPQMRSSGTQTPPAA